MAFTGWKKHRESILLRFVDGGSDIKGGQVEVLEEYFEADVRTARQIKAYDISLLGTSDFSIAGVISSLNASAVTSTAALTAQIATLTDQAAADAATIADLRAQLAALTPPPADLIGVRYLQEALAKVDLSKAWSTAIDLAVQALADIGDPDPKRVYGWWIKVADVNPQAPELALIVAQMDKAKLWGDSSLIEMLALAREIQAANNGEAVPAEAVAEA